jgi:ATP-dependent RNA helicase DeaD
MDKNSFEAFGLKDSLFKGLQQAGFKTPSPIQEIVIPIILDGQDVVAQAHTGTGKTAAFGLPAMHLMKNTGRVELLVITPTRELAAQVSEEIRRLGSYAGVRTTTVFGGSSTSRQIETIQRGVSVVVATPGRLLDLLQSKRIPDFNPSIVVLDEADEMLDMGFLDDIKKIFTFLPKDRQTLLFSATMPNEIKKLSMEILREPKFVSVTANEEKTNKDIEQRYYLIEEKERSHALFRLFDAENPTKSIIFCKTKKDADELGTILISKGYKAKVLHGDLEQNQRTEVTNSFRAGKINTLVATDVAARGLSIPDVSHVFNYHFPFDPESYVHRIGRTGRAGQKGIAITLVTPREQYALERIRKSAGGNLQRFTIPNLEQVKKKYFDRLLEQIIEQGIHEDSTTLLEMLQERFNFEDLSLQLISILIERQTFSGPDQIGAFVGSKPSAPSPRKPFRDFARKGGGGKYKDFRPKKPFYASKSK